MNPSATLSRIDFRPLLTLSVAVVGLVVVLHPAPAHALESRAFGDVMVERGEMADEVFTLFGDVTVNGPVSGDVHSAFGDVTVNEQVGGSVNAGFGDINGARSGRRARWTRASATCAWTPTWAAT